MLAQTGSELDRDLLALPGGIRRAEDRFEQISVQDKRVQVVADRLDMDVLVNQFNRLRAKPVPEQAPGAVRWYQRLVHLHEPAIVLFELRKNRLRRHRFPDACEHGEIGCEGVASIVGWHTLLRGDESLVSPQSAVAASEVRQTLLHRSG